MYKKFENKLEFNSILNILSTFCLTDLGKNQCLNLEPVNSYDKVEKLLEETAEASSFINRFNSLPITNIPDISIDIKKLESYNALSIQGLINCAHILKIARELKQYVYTSLENNNNNNSTTSKEDIIKQYPILDITFNKLYINPNIENSILSKLIDESTIDDNASSTLYNIRNKKRSLEQEIRSKLNNYIQSSKYSKIIQEPIITIRNDRFVIPIKEEYRGNIKGFIHNISSSGSTLFIEPITIFELNNDLNNLKIEENIEIEKILLELSTMLYPLTNSLHQDIYAITKLDFIFAKAKYANSINAIKPTITKERYINLIQARHPLINPNNIVPININIGKDFNTLVITGPNTGGKTVTLKTVGLLSLMTASGLFIPVNESSTICIFDNIFASIGDEQSIQESLSTFSSHMINIIEILKKATKNSLILLDELGSGTDPIEGSALAISILEYFNKLKALTISTTHYNEIKNYALSTPGFKNACVEFDISKLQPTYKILIGIPGKSNAFAICKKLGLDQTILNRAQNFISTNDISIEELLKQIYDDKAYIEKEKENIEKNSNQIKLLREQLNTKLQNIQVKESNIINNAKLEAKKILEDAKSEVSNKIKLLNNITNKIDSTSLKDLNNIRNDLNSSIKSTIDIKSSNNNTQSNITSNLKKGDSVFVKSFNHYGIILSDINNKSKRVQVQIGDLKLNVKVNDLEIDTRTKNQVKSSTLINNNTNKTHNFKCAAQQAKTEINVIGYNVEEANFAIDLFLDSAALANLETVRIVHGKGTGTLRKGIHTFLKNNPHVKSFRLGTFGEGETGVTIVNLK